MKNRVLSYFQNSNAHSPKVENLVKNTKDFDYILTDTEFEAFMLECKLIKELKPMYNKKMKTPLSYVYIGIQTEQDFGSIDVVDSISDQDYDLYFGPYTNKKTAERALEGIKEFCKILCSNPTRNHSPCLNYSMGLCIGLCRKNDAALQYRSIVHRIFGLLRNTDRSILNEMEREMLKAAERFDFETAAKYRDIIDSVKFLINKEKVIEFTKKIK